ncbi:MAG TPA: MerR family transcriptional regulator, partial [Terriglobia bacterium]|nr:MerR family transcriptional regulator [Terriglobia bacterium]
MGAMKRGKTPTLYPIRAAARLTQLSIDTLRAWEKRYAAVKPARRNGIRFYTDADIERLTLLRRALTHGHSIGAAVRMSNTDLEGLLARSVRPSSPARTEGPIERILEAVDQFNYARADRELGRLASLMSPRDLIHEVALPLLRITGEQWHEQRMRIAQEHLMSSLLGNLLGGIMRVYAPEHPPATILTATLDDDLHEFGILSAAILAAGAGLGVIHLGPNLPSREVLYAAKRSGVAIVLLALTHVPDMALRERELRSIRSGLSKNTELWLG